MRLIFLGVCIAALGTYGFQPREVPAAAASIQQQEANIGFEWAFGVFNAKGKNLPPVRISRDTVLKTGDEIKMMVKLTKDCYVYAVYLDSQGDITLLFPYTISQMQTDYALNKPYYIPKGRNWMALDKNTGKEVFFLVASTERLQDLEIKIGDYFSADPCDRKPFAQDVVEEIRALRKKYSTFATLAEKPLTIGGNIRSTDVVQASKRPDVADIAVEITAANFYSKTITIDHR